MKWSIGTKIGAGYALALILLVILGVLSYQNTNGLIEAAQMRSHTYQVLEEQAKMLAALTDAETGQRGYVITGTDQYLEPYQNGILVVKQSIQNLRKLTMDNPNQQQRIDALEPLVAAKLAELKETIDLRKNKGFDAALQVVRTDSGKKAMDDIRKIAGEMGNDERMLLEQRDIGVRTSANMTIAVIVYGIALAIAVL